MSVCVCVCDPPAVLAQKKTPAPLAQMMMSNIYKFIHDKYMR